MQAKDKANCSSFCPIIFKGTSFYLVDCVSHQFENFREVTASEHKSRGASIAHRSLLFRNPHWRTSTGIDPCLCSWHHCMQVPAKKEISFYHFCKIWLIQIKGQENKTKGGKTQAKSRQRQGFKSIPVIYFLGISRWMTTLFMESTTTVLGTRLTTEQVKSRMRTRIMLNPESCSHIKCKMQICSALNCNTIWNRQQWQGSFDLLVKCCLMSSVWNISLPLNQRDMKSSE